MIMARSKKLTARKHDKRIEKQKEKDRQVRSIKPSVTVITPNANDDNYKFNNVNFTYLRDIIMKLERRKKNKSNNFKVKIKLGGTIDSYHKVSNELANTVIEQFSN